MSDHILYSIDKDDVDKGEGTLTIDRPAKKNVVNDVRVVVQKGNEGTFAQQRMKSLVCERLGKDVGAHMKHHNRALTECFNSADHLEGVPAFLERRPPEYKGS